MIKFRLRNVLRSTGFDLRRYHPNNSYRCALHLLLRRLGVDLVFDVGANAGQTGTDLLESGFSGRVVSFEPLSAAHAELTRQAAHWPRWTAHPRAAVGSEPGEVTIHVSANSVSSSLLPTLLSHLDAAADSSTAGSESVQVIRLDDVADAYLVGARSALLKIDTQGYEWQVLDGATRLLDKVTAVQLELSLLPLYDGQRLWRDYVDRMEGVGFQLYFLYPAFTDERTGQTLQWDAMFVRRSLLNGPQSGSTGS